MIWYQIRVQWLFFDEINTCEHSFLVNSLAKFIYGKTYPTHFHFIWYLVESSFGRFYIEFNILWQICTKLCKKDIGSVFNLYVYIENSLFVY